MSYRFVIKGKAPERKHVVIRKVVSLSKECHWSFWMEAEPPQSPVATLPRARIRCIDWIQRACACWFYGRWRYSLNWQMPHSAWYHFTNLWQRHAIATVVPWRMTVWELGGPRCNNVVGELRIMCIKSTARFVRVVTERSLRHMEELKP